MTADALTRIRARGHIGIRLGLARIEAMLGRLGDPQASLRGALIAGTNGKGSVAAMVASVLQTAGYTTAQSPSPHLHSYRERITLDGRPIAADDLDPLLEEVLAAAAPSEPEHGPATEFELMTAACYLWSARQAAQVMVMEVGMGGRLDASNAWDADVAAVTNVGLDHREFLGDTLAEVAVEKAAIIKSGSLAVTGAEGEALAVIEARARSMDAPLTVCRPLPVAAMSRRGLVMAHEQLGPLELPLLGRHQAANVAVALGVLAALGDADVADVSGGAIRAGLASTRWPGRLELRRVDGVDVLIDGAHNPDGVGVLAATVEELAPSLPAGPPTLLLGAMADKDLEGMLAILARSPVLGRSRLVACAVPETDRSLPASELAEAWRCASGRSAIASEQEPAAALRIALTEARAQGGLLVVAGSLYLVGQVRALLLPGEVVS